MRGQHNHTRRVGDIECVYVSAVFSGPIVFLAKSLNGAEAGPTVMLSQRISRRRDSRSPRFLAATRSERKTRMRTKGTDNGVGTRRTGIRLRACSRMASFEEAAIGPYPVPPKATLSPSID